MPNYNQGTGPRRRRDPSANSSNLVISERWITKIYNNLEYYYKLNDLHLLKTIETSGIGIWNRSSFETKKMIVSNFNSHEYANTSIGEINTLIATGGLSSFPQGFQDKPEEDDSVFTHWAMWLFIAILIYF